MEKRKKRRQAAMDSASENPWKPNQNEIEVATYLYRKLPAKEARLSGMVVRIFLAEDAVSLLLDSPWSTIQSVTQTNPKKAKPCLFPSKDATISFLNTLIQKQMFHRAVRVVKSKVSRKRREDSKPINSKTTTSKKSSPSETKSVPERDLTASSCPKPNTDNDANSGDRQSHSVSSSTSDDIVASSKEATSRTTSSIAAPATSSSAVVTTKSSSSGSTKPMKIEMSEEQLFVMDDPQTVYVWIYEPPPGLFNWLAGSALLVAIILCCLFPIWPAELRSGAYYLTLLASALFGLLIAVALLRLCLYLLCWIATLGKYAFWLFPNYFEDCGFFESFRPIYSWTPIVNATSRGEDTSGASDTRRKDKVKSKTATSGKTDADRPGKLNSSDATETRSRSVKEDVGKLD